MVDILNTDIIETLVDIPTLTFSTSQPAFKLLASIGCTIEEVAYYFKITPSEVATICKEEGFDHQDLFENMRNAGKIAIRLAQFTLALKGNITSLTALAKSWIKDDIAGSQEYIFEPDRLSPQELAIVIPLLEKAKL